MVDRFALSFMLGHFGFPLLQRTLPTALRAALASADVMIVVSVQSGWDPWHDRLRPTAIVRRALLTVKRRMISITAYVSGLLSLLIPISGELRDPLTMHGENVDVEMAGGTPTGT